MTNQDSAEKREEAKAYLNARFSGFDECLTFYSCSLQVLDREFSLTLSTCVLNVKNIMNEWKCVDWKHPGNELYSDFWKSIDAHDDILLKIAAAKKFMKRGKIGKTSFTSRTF